jgi:hypothetical protein
MKSFLLPSAAVLGVLLTAHSTWAQAAGQLTPQTEVRLHVVDRLQSGLSRAGDRVNFRVDADVQDAEGHVLIRGGTPAYGTVTESKGKGSWGKRGHLNLSIDYTTAVDGQRVPLRGQNGGSGRKGGGAAWTTALLVAPVAGFFMKGGNVTLEPGTPLLAFVDSTLTIGAAPAGSAAPGPGMAVSMATGPAKSVLLKNGDKITGSVESLANGVYTIVTSLGTLKIAASDIRAIQELGALQAAPAPVRVVKARR